MKNITKIELKLAKNLTPKDRLLTVLSGRITSAEDISSIDNKNHKVIANLKNSEGFSSFENEDIVLVG